MKRAVRSHSEQESVIETGGDLGLYENALVTKVVSSASQAENEVRFHSPAPVNALSEWGNPAFTSGLRRLGATSVSHGSPPGLDMASGRYLARCRSGGMDRVATATWLERWIRLPPEGCRCRPEGGIRRAPSGRDSHHDLGVKPDAHEAGRGTWMALGQPTAPEVGVGPAQLVLRLSASGHLT